MEAGSGDTLSVKQLADNNDDSESSEEEEDDVIKKAPTELMLETVSAIMAKEWLVAKKLCTMILVFEPQHSQAREFITVIDQRLAQQAEESEGSSEEDSDSDEDSDDSGGDDSSSAGDSSDDSPDSDAEASANTDSGISPS